MVGRSQNTAEVSVDDLQRRLSEREQVVEALTSRLEQAAEQLDRLRRTGADRGARAVGGLPPELIERQQALTEELQQAVQQWEDMQPAELLSRVEIQVKELRDLIVDRIDHVAGPQFAFAEPAPQQARREPDSAGAPNSRAARSKDNGSGLSSYEAFKAGLLDVNDGSDATEPEPEVAKTPTPAPDKPKEHKPAPSPPVELPTMDPPTPVDFDSATLEDLLAAVDDRDTYIAFLIRRLRAAESSTRLAGSWSELQDVPEELRGRLDELEQQLQESLRLAEVEISLERARLAREAARLELQTDQLRKKAVQLGLADVEPDESAAPEESDDGDSSRKSGRWFRLFGK